jgi:hypothetical protein
MATRPQPDTKPSTERAAREERLAKALRDNLRRRKEQSRAQQKVAEAGSEKAARGDEEPPA